MKLNEILNVLSGLLQLSYEHRFDSGVSVVYKFKSRDYAGEYLGKLGIKYSKIGSDEVSISLRQYPGLFYDHTHFLREVVIDKKVFNADIGIIFYFGEKCLYYELSSDKSYSGTDILVDDHFIQNTYFYFQFQHFFESLNISEYNSSTNHEFILVNPEKGKFLLGYPVVPPVFRKEISLNDKYSKFESMNKSQEFRLLFKQQIVECLSSYEHDQRFPKFVENIESIIRDAENNYEVFLKKFDFEQLKKNFRKERDEYFEKSRSIVDRLLGRVVSIPISISAAAITIYNLKDDPNYTIIAIVTLAYIIYSLFTSFLLRLLHIDAFEIYQDLKDDLEVIEKLSNIPSALLKKETSKVYKKISVLNKTIVTLQVLLSISSLAVLMVSFLFFILSTKYISLVLIFVLDLQLLISFWGMGKNNQVSN